MVRSLISHIKLGTQAGFGVRIASEAPYLVKPFSMEELADYIDDVHSQIT